MYEYMIKEYPPNWDRNKLENEFNLMGLEGWSVKGTQELPTRSLRVVWERLRVLDEVELR